MENTVLTTLKKKVESSIRLESFVFSNMDKLRIDEHGRILLPKVFTFGYMYLFIASLLHRFLRIKRDKRIGWVRAYYKTDLASLRYLSRTVLGLVKGGKHRIEFIKESDIRERDVDKDKFGIIISGDIKKLSNGIIRLSELMMYGYIEMRKNLDMLIEESAPDWLIREYLSLINEWVILGQNLFAEYFSPFNHFSKEDLQDVVLKTIRLSANMQWKVLEGILKRVHFDNENKEFVEKNLWQWKRENKERKENNKVDIKGKGKEDSKERNSFKNQQTEIKRYKGKRYGKVDLSKYHKLVLFNREFQI